MGVEIALAAASLAAGVIQGQRAAKAAKKTARLQTTAAEKSAFADAEARATATALQQNQAAQARRKAEREKRIRIATIAQGAENIGAAGSSGEIGATGALASGTAGVIASQKAGIKAAEGISIANQASAQAKLDFQLAGLKPVDNTFGLISSALGAGATAFKGSGIQVKDLFGTSPSVPSQGPAP